MAFAGLRGTGSWGTGERPKNFREMILWLNPNGSAPLTALLARAKKESVDDPEFNWWEETLNAPRVRINYTTGYISTANTLIIDNGGLQLVAGDVLQSENANDPVNCELMLVSSVTSDTVIVVKRGIAGSTNAAIADDGYITKVGNAYEEGSASPDISQRNPTKLLNYCQIFKTAVGLTNTAKLTKTRTGDAWANDKKRKSFDHSVALELAFLFGRAYEDTSGTFPKRYVGGLRSFISTNATYFTTTPTVDTFLDAVYTVFNYSRGSGAGDERIVFAGNGFLNSLNKLVRSSGNTHINYDGIIDIYGMRLQKWVLPQGVLAIKTHPLMNLHGKYAYSAFIIDPTGLVYRPLRDTRFEDNIQANDSDTRKGQWLTEAGLEVQHEATMAYIGNVVV